MMPLPADFQPGGITAEADTTLFVGSLAHPQIVKFPKGKSTSTVFLSTSGNLSGVGGLYWSDAAQQLYTCAKASGAGDFGLRVFDASGAYVGPLSFSQAASCADFATDGSGNIYVSDSKGAIWELAVGSGTLQLWSSDPLLAPTTGSVGANGITWDGVGNLFVTTHDDGRLVKIPIGAGGAAGTGVQITLPAPLSQPGAIRFDYADNFLVVEGGAGTLDRILVNGSAGTVTQVETGLSSPTSVIKASDGIYVTESADVRKFPKSL